MLGLFVFVGAQGMLKIKVIGVVAAVGMLAACSYDVQTVTAPQLNVYSNYDEQVPNRWALVVEPTALTTTARSSSYQCSAHAFPIDLAGSFPPSVTATFENVVQEIDVLERPIPASVLVQRGYAGQIQIRGEAVRARLNFLPGFFQANVDATVELEVGLVVDNGEGRALGTRASGMGRADGSAGIYCSGGADALARASEDAVRSVLGQIAERFSNAPRIRASTIAAKRRATVTEPTSGSATQSYFPARNVRRQEGAFPPVQSSGGR